MDHLVLGTLSRDAARRHGIAHSHLEGFVSQVNRLGAWVGKMGNLRHRIEIERLSSK
jgi:hypothetical protein